MKAEKTTGPNETCAKELGLPTDGPVGGPLVELAERIDRLEKRLATIEKGVGHIISIPAIPQ